MSQKRKLTSYTLAQKYKILLQEALGNRYIAAIENRQGNDEIKISIRDVVDMSIMV